jgi:UDP-3-O-[3-hydroxymyristoyl] glucosamine N-acyltransferase
MHKLAEIAEATRMSYEVYGDGREVTKPATINRAAREAVTFYKGDDVEAVRNSKAGVVICKKFDLCHEDIYNKTFIFVEEPRLAFIRVMRAFFDNRKCEATIGRNVVIERGVVIGSPGLNFARAEDGSTERFPHYGNVIIGDNVWIGANTVIERGVIDDTVIGDGAQIDCMVLIGHQSVIGNHVGIAGSVMCSGSVTIGAYSWIGAGAVLRDGITIGHHTTIGMGSVVTKDIPDNVTAYGVPCHVI